MLSLVPTSILATTQALKHKAELSILTADGELLKMWCCMNFLSSGLIFVLTSAKLQQWKRIYTF